MEEACLGCGHLLGKKDKVCRLCGTKAGLSKPMQPTSNIQPPMDTEIRDIKVINKGRILKRIYQLLILISLIGLAIYTPPHIQELQRTSWVDPVGDFYFSSSSESLNLFFEGNHTYRIELFASGSGTSNCEIRSYFSIQNTQNTILYSAIRIDKDKGSTNSEGYSSCYSHTTTEYEFLAENDLWLLVNISLIEFNTPWNSISLQIFEDPRDYSTFEIQLRFAIFIFIFFITVFPYIFYKMTKLIMSGSASLFGSFNETKMK